MNQSCSTSYGTENASGSSKYLKPAQSLLEEMVSVGSKDIDISNQKYVEKLSHGSKKGYFGLSSELKAEFSNSNSELLGEKHGTYVNLLKLLALLEEVERRYEQYYNHMEELISSFESIAGLGAGKSYTALALQAMSKHFCSLRNAILSQIRATKLKIAKDMPKLSSRLSQLSLLDQEARQRVFASTTRDYAEFSSSVEADQRTSRDIGYGSNWFINARVRLWKPMIEEMYKEEFAESSTESDQLLTSSSTREGVGDSAEDFN
ncbi:hypothetical protein RD792_012341 [Penstemon davidsonii]|uniref:POX domain-containing protein n=1 Tax=Penstemon davidsonii TaxID=160366 RepID=A0ABR0CWK6_9LAMI|nr:hypothetical protein RD792_012341 [Penstemon davidsonii]